MTDAEDMTESLTQAIKSCKRQALTEFVKQLMQVLKQSSWDIEHLIDALADYADQRDDWEAAVKHLEDASIEISRLRHL